jgi:hypothetical protein
MQQDMSGERIFVFGVLKGISVALGALFLVWSEALRMLFQASWGIVAFSLAVGLGLLDMARSLRARRKGTETSFSKRRKKLTVTPVVFAIASITTWTAVLWAGGENHPALVGIASLLSFLLFTSLVALSVGWWTSWKL